MTPEELERMLAEVEHVARTSNEWRPCWVKCRPKILHYMDYERSDYPEMTSERFYSERDAAAWLWAEYRKPWHASWDMRDVPLEGEGA